MVQEHFYIQYPSTPTNLAIALRSQRSERGFTNLWVPKLKKHQVLSWYHVMNMT